MSSETLEAPEKAPSARDRILQVAGPLFYREGYRAIGIDRVIAEADVAKATFYKHFPSKDDLIVAWIAQAEERSQTGLPPEDGPEPLTAYVSAMIAIARRSGCMGCTYQGSAAEFSNPSHPAHAAAIDVKTRVLETLETRARAQGLARPRETAEAVFLFIEGVWASVRMFGPKAPLAHAEEAARRLFV
ncbi:TetR/AcrR family transcriptional regulator [Tabrizicola sp.]|uniref:TetR/AcrR family transcriptional regulator n=1 Tax=Tabrizicola sp. TaxID=2005166 RepID=UPI003F2F848B